MRDMLFRPAKTANHAIWQMGHLANSGAQHGHHLRSERRFFRSKTTPDSARGTEASIERSPFFPMHAELLARFNQAMDTAAAWVAKLSDADLAKPAPQRMQAMAPTVANIAILLASHPFMHMGQFTVTRRALGKPILM